MSDIIHPVFGNKTVTPATEDPKNIIWVCQCGNTTFELRPKYIATCGHCGIEVVSPDEGGMGAWQLGHEPPVPDDIPQNETGQTVINFQNTASTKRRVVSYIEQTDVAFIIIAAQSGELKTLGSVGNEAQVEWFENRIERARSLLIEGYEYDPAADLFGDDVEGERDMDLFEVDPK